MEIERKWIIKDEKSLPFDITMYDRILIKQAYFLNNEKIEGRIRAKLFYGMFDSVSHNRKYYITFKGSNKKLSREEVECEVSEDVGDFLFKQIPQSLSKWRYTKEVGGITYEFDQYLNDYSFLKLVEVEFNSEEESKNFITPSDWVEVTGDEHFYNSYIFEHLNDSTVKDKVNSLSECFTQLSINC